MGVDKLEQHPGSKRWAHVEEKRGVTWLYLTSPDSQHIECTAWVSQQPAKPTHRIWSSLKMMENGLAPRLPAEQVAKDGLRRGLKEQDLRFHWSHQGHAVALLDQETCLAFCEFPEAMGWSRDVMTESEHAQPFDLHRFSQLFKNDDGIIRSERFPQFELELGPSVVNIICECCNRPVQRTWGFITKDEAAYGVYYALLAEHGDDRWVGLTVSVGNWWKEHAYSERHWCHMQAWNDGNNFAIGVREPSDSNFSPWEAGGQALSKDEVLQGEIKEEFFAVADFVNIEDPAINSFLLGEAVSIKGRGCKHDDYIDYGGQEKITSAQT